MTPFADVDPPPALPADSPSRLNGVDLLLSSIALGVGLLGVIPLTGRLLDPVMDQQRDPALAEILRLTQFTAFYTFAFLMIGIILLLRGRTGLDIGLRGVSWEWLLGAVGLGMVFIPIRLTLVLLVALIIGLPAPEPALVEDSGAASAFSWWYLVGLVEVFLLIVVFAPLVEELIFRGVLHTWLGKAIGVLAIPISGVLFGLAHLTPLLVVSNIVLGVVLSSAYHFSRSLWVPLTIHFVNNAVVGMFLAILLVFVAVSGG